MPEYDTPTFRPVVIQVDANGNPCVVKADWMVLRRGRTTTTEDGLIWQTEPDYWEYCDPPVSDDD